MAWWFTADLHLGHKAIQEIHRKQFANTDEMDQALIDNWNNCVKGGDIVVHLGDLTMSTTKVIVESYLRRLQGNKIMVKGNHDHWLGGHRYEWHKKVNDIVIYGSHFPLRTWTQSDYRWNLHGHSHGTLEPLYNQLDVGVDNVYNLVGELRPINFDEVDTIMRSRGCVNTISKEIRVYEN